MMRVGVVGLGKLGLPVAVAISLNDGFKVTGYDLDPALRKKRPYEHREQGRFPGESFQDCLDRSPLYFAQSLEEVVDNSDVIFISVQTPHEEKFSGSTVLETTVRKDFDYTHLKSVCEDLRPLVRKDQTVSVISTVLPGTVRRELVPVLGGYCTLLYNPFFIAMGTVMRDFLNPEFVLIGCGSEGLSQSSPLLKFYDQLYGSKRLLGVWLGRDFYSEVMSYESAELTKVAYNLFISQKITFSNTLMEIAHKVPGCDVDRVSDTLSKGCDRITSPRYLRGGLGDSGGCHPRDAIAMSHLARSLNLSFNPFEVVTKAREFQAGWLCDVFLAEAGDLPKVILGRAFKPESNIVAGSCALLLADILKKRGVEFTQYDPHTDGEDGVPGWNDSSAYLGAVKHRSSGAPAAYLIATKHQCFEDYPFPPGSVVVDPHRYVRSRAGVRVVPVGVGPSQPVE